MSFNSMRAVSIGRAAFVLLACLALFLVLNGGPRPPPADLLRITHLSKRNHLGPHPPSPNSPEEAAVISANKTSAAKEECELARDCPATGCCLFGACRPQGDCVNALAPLEPVQGKTLNSTCSASSYRECTSGCCVNGKCAPHASCWGQSTSGNWGAQCLESSLQECDSGCCRNGHCRAVSECFAVGLGIELGARCAGGNASACASGCCGSNGVCVDSSVCWPGLLAPLTPAVTSKPPTTNCSRACKANSGGPCPCDHVCLCGECVPENNLAAKQLSNVFADGSQCDQVSRVLGVWRNAQVELPTSWVDTMIEQHKTYLRPEDTAEGESCAYAVGMSPVYKPCSGGKICDPRTWLCKPPAEVEIHFKKLDDACPTGEIAESAYTPGKIFKTTLGWDLPKFSCTRCLVKWGGDWLVSRDCPSGTECDVNGIDGRAFSGLCVPTVAIASEVSVQGSLPCSGQTDVGNRAGSAAECSSCYWDVVTKVCSLPPGKFIESIRYMPKGTSSPLVNANWPMRNNEVITGYPDYASSAFPYSNDAQLTYEYLSCLATRGESADIRLERYTNDFMLQAHSWWEQLTSTAWSHPDCTDFCAGPAAGSRRASTRSLQRRLPLNPTKGPCKAKFADKDGILLPNSVAALKSQGGEFRCEVYCHVKAEADWISNSAVKLVDVNNKMLTSSFSQTKANLQAAQQQLGDAPLHVPEKDAHGYLNSVDFWTELVSFGLDLLGLSFPVETLTIKLAGKYGGKPNSYIETAEKCIKAIEFASTTILYGGNVNEKVSPEKPIEQAFGTALGVDLKAEELYNAVAWSLGNASLSFSAAIKDVISDRNKLRYLSAYVDMLDMNLEGQAQQFVMENIAAIDDQAKRSFVKQLLPSMFDLCYVNEVDGWPDTVNGCPWAGYGPWYSNDQLDGKLKTGQCPHYCDSLKKADNSLNPQPHLKQQNEMTYTWATQGMKYPELPAESARYNQFAHVYPNTYLTWPQQRGLVRTRFWMCARNARKETMNTTLWENVLGCEWRGPEEADEGRPAGRYLCDDGKIDVQQLMFDASYWSTLEKKHPVLNGRGAHFGWPALRTYDPTLGAMCVGGDAHFPIG